MIDIEKIKIDLILFGQASIRPKNNIDYHEKCLKKLLPDCCIYQNWDGDIIIKPI